MSTRGEHLLRADRRFSTGGGRLARLVAPAFSKVLDEIDRKLLVGGILVLTRRMAPKDFMTALKAAFAASPQRSSKREAA